MDDSTACLYIVVVFFIVLFLSRIISPIIRNIYGPGWNSSLLTFAIVFIIDSIAMYFLVKFGYGRGIFDALNLISVKIFFFVFFYFMGVVMIEYFVREIHNYINFISQIRH